MIAFLKIVGLSILVCVAYGIVHDQITARICVEYFTIGHPPILNGTQDPTLLAFGWGFLATWWVGAMLGIPLGFVSRVGTLRKTSASDLWRPMLVLMGSVGCLAAMAGVAGYVAASNGWVWLMPPLAAEVPSEKHVPFLVDLWIHLGSYAGGFLGGGVLMIWIVIDRYRRTHGPGRSREVEAGLGLPTA